MQNISTEHSEVDIYKTQTNTNQISCVLAKKSDVEINIFMDKRKGRKPGTWKTGPCPVLHQKYHAYGLARAQAMFRGEPWLFTFETWVDTWGVMWCLRGRASRDLCMTRCDLAGAWEPANVMLIQRREHTLRHHHAGHCGGAL